MFKLIFLIAFALPAFGQEVKKIGNRATGQDAQLCSEIGGTEECLTIDSGGQIDVPRSIRLPNLTGFAGGTSQFIFNDGSGFLMYPGDGAGEKLRINNHDNSANLVVLDNDTGKLGVGISNANRRLHVHGTDGSFDSHIAITNGTTGTATNDGFRIGINQGSTAVDIWSYENDAMFFGTNNATAAKIGADQTFELKAKKNDCGIGNLCSDNNTVTCTPGSNTNTCFNSGSIEYHAIRVGGTTTLTLPVTPWDVSGTPVTADFTIQGLPFKSNNFSNSNQAGGVCTRHESADKVWITANSGTTSVRVFGRGFPSMADDNQNMTCVLTYQSD